MILEIVHILFLVLFIYLSVNILYLFVLSIAGHTRKKKAWPVSAQKKRFAVLITSYKEDEIIFQTAEEASQHDYPQQYFDVYIAADQLSDDTITKLAQLKVTVMPVHFELGSKARSLNYLLNRIIKENYDVAMILDGDNIMLPGCLEKVNSAFQNGSGAVQCHRIAKNKNTAVAILDAISEEINNHLFRRAQRALGFSASTIGSGMAFSFAKLRQVYNKPGILGNPACDREVDFEMMKDDIIVEYLEDAYVLDEKVSRNIVFQNQRTRWLESQLIHLKLFFSAKEHVAHKTRNYWNKLFINLIPPRMIFLAVFCLILLIGLLELFLKKNFTGLPFSSWLILFVMYSGSLALSVPRSLYSRNTAMAFLHLPLIMVSFLKAALKMNSSRKEFVHTPKTYTNGVDSTKI